MLLRRTVALGCVAALFLTLTACRDDAVPVPRFTAHPVPARQEITVTNPDRPAEIRGLLDEIGALLARIRALVAPPAPEPEPDPAPKPDAPGFHTVRPGDTLSRIAAAHRLSVDDLARWNAIVDRNVIRIGQVLRLTAPAPTPAPAPAPAPAPGPPAGVPVGARVLFDASFANLAPFYAQTFDRNGPAAGYSSRAIQTVNAGPGHETAVRFEVRPGDVPNFGGGERAELRLDDEGNTAPGDERWYQFSLMFDDFPPPQGITGGGHMIVMQWHTGDASPLLSLNVDGRGNFTIGERWDNPSIIGPVDEGVWHDYVLHVRFSRGSDGLVEMWRDGRKVAERRQATHRDDANYLKLGIYRADEPFAQSLLYDNLRITAP